MRFYTKTHKHYCGIDLHARSMYLCILDREGEVLLHRNMKATPEAFLGAIAPYREDLVVAVECIYLVLARRPYAASEPLRIDLRNARENDTDFALAACRH